MGRPINDYAPQPGDRWRVTSGTGRYADWVILDGEQREAAAEAGYSDMDRHVMVCRKTGDVHWLDFGKGREIGDDFYAMRYVDEMTHESDEDWYLIERQPKDERILLRGTVDQTLEAAAKIVNRGPTNWTVSYHVDSNSTWYEATYDGLVVRRASLPQLVSLCLMLNGKKEIPLD